MYICVCVGVCAHMDTNVCVGHIKAKKTFSSSEKHYSDLGHLSHFSCKFVNVFVNV